ncbi:MAG: hypothetical protein SFU83_20535 [Meiothermus sp.]|nr:hypothetical protein [Meiothermus sp.]
MRIRIIAPTADYRPETLKAIAQDLAMLRRPGVVLEHFQLEQGPLAIRTAEDETIATSGVGQKWFRPSRTANRVFHHYLPRGGR